MTRGAVVLMVGVLFSGCQKLNEYYSRGTRDLNTSCRISHYTYEYYESEINTYIDYDSKGNPVKITYFDEWLPDGQGKEVFEYDQLNRLVRHVPDEYLGNKRTYIYEGNSPNPVRDTAEDFYGNKFVESFDFDYSGRIIKEEIEWVVVAEDFEIEPGGMWKEIKRYYYDVHGNRQVNPFDNPWHKTIHYSDKPSLYSLHRTWQLVFRDYSKYNASKIKTVNQEGLPLTFVVSELDYWQPFFDLAQNATITYDCNYVK